MWGYLRSLGAALRRPAFIFLTFMSLTLILLSAGAFYFIEGNSNPDVPTFLEAVYFAVTTMTGVGYGDITPQTPLGKVLSIFMMLAGTATYVSFTAILATALMEIEFEQAKRRSASKKAENSLHDLVP